ncbi:MAG: hypothetical protein IPH37_07980 [Burkholderiales bacterium]|nr:hypothetical protein [Burkholderiales bacterium]
MHPMRRRHTALVDALAAWAWHALQFTPLVAQVDGVLVLEVSQRTPVWRAAPVAAAII